MTLMVIIQVLKILIAVSIFYVWIIRYSNIIKEFNEYGLPNWFRDIMGIIKCSSAVMLLFGTIPLTLIASSSLFILMMAAFLVHIKFKHTMTQMMPSFSLILANSFILYQMI